MRWNQLAILNGIVAVALWLSPVRAAAAYFLEPLNFKLTVAQQQIVTHTNNYPTFTINSAKLTNKGLLSLLASAFDTNWPTGANLALDRWSGNIYVVDATGTNPVFNASQGISLDDTNVAFFRCEFDRPVTENHQLVKARPGGASEHSADGTRYGMVFFYLFIEQDGVTNTDLSFAGLDAADYHSHFIQFSNAVPTFTNSFYGTQETIPVMGDGVFDETWSVVEGTVTSQLVLKGVPPFGAPIPPFPMPPPLRSPNGFTNGFTNIVIPPIVVIPPTLLTNSP
jgi:hypothetical protein